MAELDIAEVARRSGLPASALRFYEEKGLIAPIGRRGLRRVYDARVLDRLALIALGRIAGLALEQIAPMLGRDGKARIDRKLLARRADEIDASIATLAKVRDGLRHAVVCPAPSHLECPTFRRLMQAAGRAPRPRAARKASPRQKDRHTRSGHSASTT